MKKIIDFIKNSKYQILFGIAFIIFGAVILFSPGTTLKTVCFVLGIAVGIKGITSLVIYTKARNKGEEKITTLLSGILTLAGAFILMWHPQKLLSIIPIIIGIGVLAYGISTLLSKKGGLISRIISIITIIVGAGIVGSPFKLAEAVTSVIGFALIVIGILIIATEISLNKYIKLPESNDGYQEVEFTDVDE